MIYKWSFWLNSSGSTWSAFQSQPVLYDPYGVHSIRQSWIRTKPHLDATVKQKKIVRVRVWDETFSFLIPLGKVTRTESARTVRLKWSYCTMCSPVIQFQDGVDVSALVSSSCASCFNRYKVHVCLGGSAQGCLPSSPPSRRLGAASGLSVLLSVSVREHSSDRAKRQNKFDRMCFLTLRCVCFVFVCVCVCLGGMEHVSLHACVAAPLFVLPLITGDYLWPPLTSSASLSSQPVKPVIPAGKLNDSA